jgi:hypothetical protein
MLREIEITFHDHVWTVCQQLDVLDGRFDANLPGGSLAAGGSSHRAGRQ